MIATRMELSASPNPSNARVQLPCSNSEDVFGETQKIPERSRGSRRLGRQVRWQPDSSFYHVIYPATGPSANYTNVISEQCVSHIFDVIYAYMRWVIAEIQGSGYARKT